MAVANHPPDHRVVRSRPGSRRWPARPPMSARLVGAGSSSVRARLSTLAWPLAASLLVAVVLIAVGASTSRAAGVDLSLPDLHGRERSLSDYRGRVVVLNFWATWCGACRQEMPTLISVGHQYQARGVEVIAVSLDEPGSERAVSAFVDELGIDFPVWVGGSTADLRRFGLEPALPGTVFIDKQGHIADRIVGAAGHAKLAAKLDALLGSGGGRSSPELEAISGKPVPVWPVCPL